MKGWVRVSKFLNLVSVRKRAHVPGNPTHLVIRKRPINAQSGSGFQVESNFGFIVHYKFLWGCFDLIFHFSRDPRSIVEHENELAGMTPQQLKDLIANNTPKATRNIFLIRHGQYKKEKAKEKKKLTQLGI